MRWRHDGEEDDGLLLCMAIVRFVSNFASVPVSLACGSGATVSAELTQHLGDGTQRKTYNLRTARQSRTSYNECVASCTCRTHGAG